LVTFCAVMALYAAVTEGSRPMLFGMAVFPLAYAGTGALYHHDLLWMAHFPPSLPFDPGNPIYAKQRVGLRYLIEPAAAHTPAAVCAAALPFRRLARIERVLLAYVVLIAVLMNVLAIFRVGNFGGAPRYFVHMLPPLALLVGCAVGPWWDGDRPHLPALLATVLVGIWVVTRQEDGRTFNILLGAYALVMVAVCLRAGTLAAGVVVALILSGPVLPLRTEVTRAATAAYLKPMFAWLQAHPEQSRAPIYTNAQLLAPFLEWHLPHADVYHMAGIDMVREVVLLTNPDNGQRDRIRQLCAIDLYGKTLFAPITPEALPNNALLALREDARLPLLLPETIWKPRLELLVKTPEFWIARLRPVAPFPAETIEE